MIRIPQMEPTIGPEEAQAVAGYLGGGGWLTEHVRTREFEKAIADYVGARHCSVVANGTVSLVAALLAMNVGAGDEVLVPDFTMIATANVVRLVGATPVFVDVSPVDLCIDLAKAEPRITSRTKAIIHVSLNGRATNMPGVRAWADAHKLQLLEDSAQSLGASCDGAHLGTFGAIGSFSFSAPKIITTGQGGALVTDDDRLFERIRLIRDFGREKSGVDHHIAVGYNFKFTDLQAVIGLEQLKRMPARVARKKAMFARYQTGLAGLSEVRFLHTDLRNVPPWFIDPLCERRSELSAFLALKGIGSRPFYPAIHSEPAYGMSGSFPVSEMAAAEGLWLPSSVKVTDAEIDEVCAEVRAFYSQTT